jgi:hypothetical protein
LQKSSKDGEHNINTLEAERMPYLRLHEARVPGASIQQLELKPKTKMHRHRHHQRPTQMNSKRKQIMGAKLPPAETNAAQP